MSARGLKFGEQLELAFARLDKKTCSTPLSRRIFSRKKRGFLILKIYRVMVGVESRKWVH